jgi:hypothetical protein
MTHAFDSDLAKPQRTLVRDGVVAALEGLRRPTLYLAAVVLLPAPIRAGQQHEEAFLREAVSGQTPAVAIALGGRDFESVGTDNIEWTGDLDVHVYCCTTHARGLVAGRTAADVVADADATADPGLETIGEHVFERLAGLPLTAANAAELRPVREEYTFVDADMTVVEQVYKVTVNTDVDPARARTQLALEVDATHTEAAAGDPADREALSELDPP